MSATTSYTAAHVVCEGSFTAITAIYNSACPLRRHTPLLTWSSRADLQPLQQYITPHVLFDVIHRCSRGLRGMFYRRVVRGCSVVKIIPYILFDMVDLWSRTHLRVR